LKKYKRKISVLFLKIFVGLIIFCEIFFNPITLNANQFNIIDNNLTKCISITNCSYQNWRVDDSEIAFAELIQILENTPRLKIIKKDKDYIHAIAISRIMKFIDDIEIKSLNEENILQVKSSSRLGIYDLGVNKRRVETLRFRLIDLYA
tara:strand:+ start:29 stop:475 length:447 start_codon:yes stop_codon:yes gene_type:complete